MSDRGDLSATLPAQPDGGDGPHLPERTRIGRYQIHRRLGAGAMGVVYEAHDPQLDRKVAIKVVHPRRAMDPTGADRLLREARALARLKHPNVIAVHDAGWADERLFVAMELIDGTSLGGWLERPRRWQDALAVMLEAGRGLAAAHAAGILHRDFKPDNVLVASDGRVCVGDFGLAELGTTAAAESAPSATTTSSDPKLTTTGALLGTPAYMAAEQHLGKPVDARADQFAFCVSLWEALFGERPFAPATTEGGVATVLALGAEVIGGRIRPPPRGHDVPRWLEQTVRRGLRVDPDARFPSMDALLDALDPGPRRRRRAFVFAGLGLGVAAAAVAVAVAVTRDDASPAPKSVVEPPPGTSLVLADQTLVTDTPVTSGVWATPDGREVLFLERDRATAIRLPDGRRRAVTAPPDQTFLSGFFDPRGQITIGSYTPDRTLSLATWDPATTELVPVRAMPSAAAPFAATADGTMLAIDGSYRDPQIVAADGDRWRPIGERTRGEFPRLSPDSARVAMSTARPPTIRVTDLATGSAKEYPLPAAPLGLVWTDPTHVLYGDLDGGEVGELDLTTGETRVRRVRDGASLLTPLALRDRGRLLVLVSTRPMHPRMIATDATGQTELPTTAQPLGWASEDQIVFRDVETSALFVSDRQVRTRTPLGAVPDPIDVSIADGLLVSIERGDTGCVRTARGLDDGATRWRRDVPCEERITCAADRTKPCVTLAAADGKVEVRRLALATGEAGAIVASYQAAQVESQALSVDGAELAITRDERLAVIRLPGGSPRVLANAQPLRVSSLVYGRRDELFFAGTDVDAGRRALFAVDPSSDGAALDAVWSSTRSVLLLARSSPSGDALTFVEIGYQQDLVELNLPP